MYIFAKVLMRLWVALSFLWTLFCGILFLSGEVAEDERWILLVLWLVPIGFVWLCAMLLLWVVSAVFEKDDD